MSHNSEDNVDFFFGLQLNLMISQIGFCLQQGFLSVCSQISFWFQLNFPLICSQIILQSASRVSFRFSSARFSFGFLLNVPLIIPLICSYISFVQIFFRSATRFPFICSQILFWSEATARSPGLHQALNVSAAILQVVP